jgi:outer membrane cobalamin receptor
MLRLRLLAIAIVTVLGAGVAPIAAEPASVQLNISLIDASDAPIAGAVVELNAPPTARVLRCDNRGQCGADDIKPDTYELVVRTNSISATLDEQLVLVAAKSYRVLIRVIGTRAVAINTLGTVRITPTGTLSAGSAPSVELNAQALAQRGDQSLVQSLAQEPGVTLNRPVGATPGLPTSIILRGSDPKETIIQIDGQPINNSSTGDFDVSLLDPSTFSKVQILYGLAPASLVGANTEGGTVNFHTLEPTTISHSMLRYLTGSFATSAYTFAATGSADKLGYAFDLHSYNQQGEVHNYPVQDSLTGDSQTLGSGRSGSSMLEKLRYALGMNGMIEVSVLSVGANNDLSAPLSTPTNPSNEQPGAIFTSFAGSERSTVSTFYNADLRLPLGAEIDQSSPTAFITARHLTSNARQIVTGPANGLSEYLVDSIDALNDNSLEYDRLLPNADLALVARTTGERLTVPDQFGAEMPTQTQTSTYVLARYTWNGGLRLRYTAAAYYSHYSIFGTSFDPRAGAVWTPNPRTVVRASVGTGFQAPLLSEKIVPIPLPPPDVNGLIFVGNPKLSADHTTEYELDVEQFLGQGPVAAHGELDFYRHNIRGDDLQFIPAGASPATPKLSYPINLTTSIAQGVVATVAEPIDSKTIVSASYDLNAAYPLALPPSLINAIGNIVPFQQSQGIPLHRATLSIQQQAKQLSWTIGVAYEGANNDLNQPQFALVGANFKYALGHTEMVIAANNLTNVYARRFTLAGAGVPYPGIGALIPTDAFALQAPSLTASITQRW